MKTFDELISTGAAAEIAEALKARSTQFSGLAAKSITTQTELDEMNALDDEMEKLTAKHVELKKLDDAKTRNEARTKAFSTPVGQVPFSGSGEGDGNRKAYVPAYSSVASLKHITFGTRQENEETAYRFFQFWAATSRRSQKAFDFCIEKGIPVVGENGNHLKTVNELNNNQGGVLVPPEFDATLIRLIEQYGRFRQFAMMSPMSRETKSQPRRTGGVTAYWVKEAATITASNPTYDLVELVAKKLAALCIMSSEISEDSAINIADQLAFEIGYAFALAEDQAGFIGDSSNTYGGITGICPKLKGLSGTIANIAGLYVASGNLFSEFALADFNNTLALLPQYADTQNSAWYVHKTFYHAVMQRLELAAGGVTAMEISAGDRRPRPLFLGYPVNFVQVMPRVDANSQIAALLGDLALAATMGDRRERTLATDPYSLFTTDQLQVRGTERIDINVHDVGNASGTAADRVAGPVVGLISAAS